MKFLLVVLILTHYCREHVFYVCMACILKKALCSVHFVELKSITSFQRMIGQFCGREAPDYEFKTVWFKNFKETGCFEKS